jgi:hypothetical protein
LADIFAGTEVRRYPFDNQEVPPASIAALVEENRARRTVGLGLWLICRTIMRSAASVCNACRRTQWKSILRSRAGS